MGKILRTYIGILLIFFLISGGILLLPWDHKKIYLVFTTGFFSVASLATAFRKNYEVIQVFRQTLIVFSISSIGIAVFLRFLPFSPISFLNGDEFIGLGIIALFILGLLYHYQYYSSNPSQNSLIRFWPFILAVGLVLVEGFPVKVIFPKPSGPYRVGTRSYNFLDANRRETLTQYPHDLRELMLQFSYPSAKDSNSMNFPYKQSQRFFHHSRPDVPVLENSQKFPVILYSAGAGGSRFDNTLQIEALSSHGYVVVAIDHTFLNSTRFPSGIQLPYDTEHLKTMKKDDFFMETIELGTRVSDLQHVIEKVTFLAQDPDFFLFDRLDYENVGVFGWSIGGAAAGKLCTIDSRFKAGINLDGWDWMELNDTTKFLGNFMYVHSDREEISSKDLRVAGVSRKKFEEMERKQALYFESLFPNSPKEVYLLTIKGSMHSNFRDHGFLGLGLLGERDGLLISQMTNTYMLAFFDQYLQKKPHQLFDESAKTSDWVTLRRN